MSELKITLDSLENAILKDGQFVFGIAETNGTIISDASGAIAGGYIENGNITANAPGAIALGIGTTANSSGMLAVGQYNTTNSYNGHAALFKVGNGKGPDALGGKNHDALAIYNNIYVSPAVANQSYVIINGDVSVSGGITANVNGVSDVYLGCPIGTVVMWAGSELSVPVGWLICDGRYILIDSDSYPTIVTSNFKDYLNLVNVIYNTYGGDTNISIADSTIYPTVIGNYTMAAGSKAIKIPDLRLRFPLGAKDNSSIGKYGHGLSASGYSTTRGYIGGSDVHTLTADESGLPSHNHSFRNGDLETTGTMRTWYGDSNGSNDSSRYSSSTGGNDADQSHNNIPPFLAINFIIKYK